MKFFAKFYNSDKTVVPHTSGSFHNEVRSWLCLSFEVVKSFETFYDLDNIDALN